MNTNQPNPRHVEILAEEEGINKYRIINGEDLPIWSSSALTAMQRAVEEAELKNKEYAQGFKDERDQWVNNWNHLDKLYQAQQSELTTLRTELERVRGAIRTEIDYYDAGDTSTIDKIRSIVDWKSQQTEGGDNEN
jgi:hypothetical protein